MADARICILGSGGMLGRDLLAACTGNGSVLRGEVHGLGRADLDIADPQGVRQVLDGLRPTVVINAAAYTDVDGCESHPESAHQVNADGPAHLAAWCAASGARLVHVSTDFVFDGRKGAPYEEDDEVAPLNVYGRSKAEGERRVRELLPAATIVRTSWLFAAHGRNFVRTILRLAGERPELRVVDDQVGSPTGSGDLAEAILALAAGGRSGTYHFSNRGVCTWYAFAVEIVRQAGLAVPVVPVCTAELARPAARPAYSVLNTAKYRRDTGLQPRPWQEALAGCLSRLALGRSISVQVP